MKKFLSLMLGGILFAAGLFPTATQVQAQTQEELVAQFQAEFEAYAATHTQEELEAYIHQRLDQITAEGDAQAGLELSASPHNIEWYSKDLIIYTPGDPGEESRLCLQWRRQACYQAAQAEIMRSLAASSAILAACLALSGGAGSIICGAIAVAAHSAGVAAAVAQKRSCDSQAVADCFYGGR